jgi:taurine dioxygenase
MAWRIEKLGPDLGAAVTGLDAAAALDDAAFAELRAAWLSHGGLLVLRDQDLDPDGQVAFARRFGPLYGEADQFQESVRRYLLPGQPALYRVSNKVVDGVAQGRARAGDYWHSDVSFRARPAAASLLYAIELPETGGDTLFADMARAYAALPEATQARLAGLRAVHDFQIAARGSGTYDASQLEPRDFDGTNRAVHPVVITHPETGRKAIFVNPGFTAAVLGLAPGESDALLAELQAHATRPEFVTRHEWRPGDLVIWDNRSLMHRAVVDYEGRGARYLHRATVIAEPPRA